MTTTSKKIKGLQLNDQKSLMDFLKNPTIKIAETLTGILASDKKDWKLSAGRLVQSVIKGNLLTQFGREIESYSKEGRIKEDYFATNKNKATLYELLKFLDENIPDEELFKALKSIFFSGVSKDASSYDEALAYEFLQTAKKLTGTEILILKANYELVKGKVSREAETQSWRNNPTSRETWKRVITKQMGYGELSSIVSKYEYNLESLGLISPRHEMDRLQGEFESPANNRLTEMGLKFCEFVLSFN